MSARQQLDERLPIDTNALCLAVNSVEQVEREVHVHPLERASAADHATFSAGSVLRDILKDMGRPLMIQEDDDRRIERLKRRLGIATKIDVVRAGMTLLEQDALRRERLRQWKRAAASVAADSAVVNAEFRQSSRLKRP